jgi:hypothetical protein
MKTGAIVFISAYVGTQNKVHMLSVPLTWIPINLTAQAPRAAILGSQYFLNALDKNMIELVDAEVAEAELATPRAMAEVERLSQEKAAIAASIRNPNADEFKLTLEGGSPNAGTAKTYDVTSFFDVDTVSVSFKAWVNKANNLDEESAIRELLSKKELSFEEMQYLADNTKHPRIRKGLNKRIAAMGDN